MSLSVHLSAGDSYSSRSERFAVLTFLETGKLRLVDGGIAGIGPQIGPDHVGPQSGERSPTGSLISSFLPMDVTRGSRKPLCDPTGFALRHPLDQLRARDHWRGRLRDAASADNCACSSALNREKSPVFTHRERGPALDGSRNRSGGKSSAC